ncbi:MAG: hypothetical protein Q4C68_05125 [Moraxella sp.]|nr:hypothetical protein [Moraxella sp.]
MKISVKAYLAEQLKDHPRRQEALKKMRAMSSKQQDMTPMIEASNEQIIQTIHTLIRLIKQKLAYKINRGLNMIAKPHQVSKKIS